MPVCRTKLLWDVGVKGTGAAVNTHRSVGMYVRRGPRFIWPLHCCTYSVSKLSASPIQCITTCLKLIRYGLWEVSESHTRPYARARVWMKLLTDTNGVLPPVNIDFHLRKPQNWLCIGLRKLKTVDIWSRTLLLTKPVFQLDDRCWREITVFQCVIRTRMFPWESRRLLGTTCVTKAEPGPRVSRQLLLLPLMKLDYSWKCCFAPDAGIRVTGLSVIHCHTNWTWAFGHHLFHFMQMDTAVTIHWPSSFLETWPVQVQ
jgi:hypothetical protein